MATRNPARAGRIATRQRGIEPGERADLVEFAFDRQHNTIAIERVFLDGDCVYSA
jgi:N-acetylglucosamine-6-phosphate deacetylase